MRITDIGVHVVNLPLRSPFASSFETKRGETRTIVRIETDEGITGWGETMWGRPVARLVEQLGERMIGTDPCALETFHRRERMVPFFHGYLGYAAIAALDVACWDVIGKRADLGLVDLLGGRFRERIPLTALITRADGDPRDYPASLADAAERTIAEFGFGAVKLKGSEDPFGDAAIMEALRERLPDIELRVDPNAAWTCQDSIRAGRRMEPLDLEYLEDPCAGIEQMAQVARAVRIPLCTNMCVVRPDDLAPAVRLDAVQVIHGDVYKWGGIAPTKNLAAHCETFGLGMNLHSGGELGIATAVHCAVVASTPILDRAIDSMYYLHDDDVVAPLTLEDGALRLPDGPGIGVVVDEEKLAHYEQRNAEEGDYTS